MYPNACDWSGYVSIKNRNGLTKVLTSLLCFEFSFRAKGMVDIQFINLSDNVRLEEGDVYQMVESTVYFEAYRHILEGLKEVDPARLPLQVTNSSLITPKLHNRGILLLKLLWILINNIFNFCVTFYSHRSTSSIARR